MIKQMIDAASGLLKGNSFESYYQDVQGGAVDAITFDEARKDYEGSLRSRSNVHAI